MAGHNRLVFTHLPKAAGSSINTLLFTIMTECAESTLAYAGAASVFADPALPLTLLQKYGLEPSEFGIITGHIPFACAKQCFAPASFATVLRNPAHLLISSYCSQPENKDLPDYGLGRFEEYMEVNPYAEWAIDNLQTRMLCDTPRFGVHVTQEMLEAAKRNLQQSYSLVGFQDRLDAFVHGLNALYALSMDVTPHFNDTGEYGQHVREEHLAFAARWNKLDMELYEWAHTRFAQVPVLDAIGEPRRGPAFRKVVLGPDVFELAYEGPPAGFSSGATQKARAGA